MYVVFSAFVSKPNYLRNLLIVPVYFGMAT
jgi:hypothetical protein